MTFEWDEAKRLRNVRRHGLDFVDAVRVFDGRPVVTIASPRSGELRLATIGVLVGRYVTVVWTWRGMRRRLISARRARHVEAERHREVHG